MRGIGVGRRLPRCTTLEAREDLIVGDLVLVVLTDGQGKEDPREKARVEVPRLDIFARRSDKRAKEANIFF